MRDPRRLRALVAVAAAGVVVVATAHLRVLRATDGGAHWSESHVPHVTG